MMMFTTIVIRTLLENETDPKRKKMMLKMVYRIINN